MTQLMGQEPIHTAGGIIDAQLDRLAPADVAFYETRAVRMLKP